MSGPGPIDLPPDLNNFPDLIAAINDRYRQQEQQIDGLWVNPGTAVYRMGNHRIGGVADPIDNQDAVNLQTLRKYGTPGSTPPPPPQSYGIVFDNAAALSDSETIPAYVVAKSREGAPRECWIYSRVAAPGDVKINFGVLVAGKGSEMPLLAADLVLPSGQKGPIFVSSGLKITNFPKGTVVYPTITSGSSATMCSMGISVRRPPL